MVNRTTVLRFEDTGHVALHTVLTGHGFGFQVDPDGRVGRIYSDAKRQLEVELADGDGELRATIRMLAKPMGEQVPSDETYTEIEQLWLDDAVSESDYLTRELHILRHVRPNSMHRPPEDF